MNWIKTKRNQIVNMLVFKDLIINKQVNLWSYIPDDYVRNSSFEFGIVVNVITANWADRENPYTLVFNGYNEEISCKFKDYLQGVLDEKYSRVDNINRIIEPGHNLVDVHFKGLMDNLLNLGVSLE